MVLEVWIAGSNPRSICLSHCVLGQGTSPALPTAGGQSRHMAASLLSDHPKATVAIMQCVNVCVCELVNDWMQCEALWDPLDLIKSYQIQAQAINQLPTPKAHTHTLGEVDDTMKNCKREIKRPVRASAISAEKQQEERKVVNKIKSLISGKQNKKGFWVRL